MNVFSVLSGGMEPKPAEDASRFREKPQTPGTIKATSITSQSCMPQQRVNRIEEIKHKPSKQTLARK